MMRAVSDVPVIVATARDDEGLIVRLLDAGADDYVVKPVRSRHTSKPVSGPSCAGSTADPTWPSIHPYASGVCMSTLLDARLPWTGIPSPSPGSSSMCSPTWPAMPGEW